MTMEEYTTRRDSLTTLISSRLFQNVESLGSAKKGAYLSVAYMKTDSLNDWLEMERKVWKPVADQMIKDGVQSGWSVNIQAFGHLADNTPVIVVGTTDPDDAVYELNASTGAQLWRFQAIVGTDSDVGAPPTISPPGVNGFADGVVYETPKSAVTYALDLQTGAVLWQFDLRTGLPGNAGNPAQSGASLVGNAVYIGAREVDRCF